MYNKAKVKDAKFFKDYHKRVQDPYIIKRVAFFAGKKLKRLVNER